MSTPTPNTQASIDFLKWFEPEGPWLLFAKVNQKLHARLFRPAQEEECRNWIASHNGSNNMYVAVNPPMHDKSEKTELTDLKEMRWLHVDIDARAGEDLAEEMERIRGLIGPKFPGKELPEPSVAIMSGGGCWVLWRLTEPQPINGDKLIAEDLKHYNLRIAHLMTGDQCHNLDRIMRLPGTVNIPDEKKIKKGRVPELAVVVFQNDNAYPISDFKKAQPTQTSSSLGFTSPGTSGPQVEISGNVPRVMHLDELKEYNLSDRTIMIISRGRDAMSVLGPKDGKDNSRSAWLMEAVCSMVKAGVPNDTIYSLITDQEWGISESIVDKGSSADKHARRTIERAHEFVKDPRLAEMNGRFAVISSIGGKCRVVEEVEDLVLGRTQLVKQTFEDFGNRFSNKKVEIQGKDGPIYIPLGKWWLGHPDRRQYDRIVFAPNKERPGVYNLWRGFAFDPRPGDCSLYLNHLRDVVCGGNDEYYQYLIRWMARCVQYPERTGEVAIVLRGEQGTGKGITIKLFGNLFGRHFLQIADSKHLIGNFNSHLRDAVVVFADEAFYAGDKKHESILKTIVTEPTLLIEGKGVDAEVSSNCIHLMMASNSNWVVPAGDHERRYLVLDVGSSQRQNSAYFSAMVRQMENGGYNSLLLHLQGLDVEPESFDVRAMPRTKALGQQQDYTLSYEESWWYEKLRKGELFTGKPGWPGEVVKDFLFKDWIDHTKMLNVQRRLTETAWNNFMRRELGDIPKKQKSVQVKEYDDRGVATLRTERKYVIQIPSLARCRELWDINHGVREWGEGELPPEPELPPAPVKEPF